jgi:hypothetical protein
LVYIVASDLEILDLEGLRFNGCKVIRDGGFPLIREYFSRFDDEETSEVRYLILKADLSTDHLVNPQLISRALVHLVRAHHGSVVIPRREWDCIEGGVSVNLGKKKVWLLA